MDEQLLAGGNASGQVVRAGDTVRKPWVGSSEAVQRFLALLRAAGLDVPRPLGRDEHRRQVVEYVEGTPAIELPALGLADLTRVGGMIRTLHDVSAEVIAASAERWDVLLPVAGADLIGHNDLAPWNLIIGERWVFIDWDVAGEPVAAAADRLRAFIDGYGAEDHLRAELPAALTRRTIAMSELLRSASSTGFQPWAQMFHDGHGSHWRAAARYVAEHEAGWTAAVT
jgi:hypothetical protein